jgi:hypothetical protein
MSLDAVMRTVLLVFLGILFILQLYFGYRMKRSQKLPASDAATKDPTGLSRQASFRFAVFLTIFWVFFILWVVYEMAVRHGFWFLGAAAIVVALLIAREPLAITRRMRPVAAPPCVPLVAQPDAAEKVTPEYVQAILADKAVIAAIKDDLSKTGQIGYKEVWRLGLIVPDRDQFDPGLSELSHEDRWRRFKEDNNYRLNLLEQIPLHRTATLYNPGTFNIQFERLTVRGGSAPLPIGSYPGWSYPLGTRQQQGEYRRIREFEVDTDSVYARNRSRSLARFLHEDGFPLNHSYSDGDPLTADRGGTIVMDKGKLIIIHPRYFVQRRLIDDCGDLA